MKTKKTIKKVIAFAVDKGGTGKTTTVINTGAKLASEGYKVLLVDVDQQANLTKTILKKMPEDSMYESLLDDSKPLPIIEVKGKNIALVPASNQMFGIGIKVVERHCQEKAEGKAGRGYIGILRRLLEPIKDDYDVILIDCPPSDNIMTLNALFAADGVLIVSNPEPYCIDGVKNFCEIIRSVRQNQHALDLVGILINNFDTGSRGHKLAEDALREAAPKHVFKTHIRHSWPLYNAALNHMDIFEYSKDSNGAKDYESFVNELIFKI